MLPEVDPEIRLGISAYFPESYIPDTNQRLYFYKRLASLRDHSELEELKAEIKDRFGPYGEVVENLFLVMHLRRVLKNHLVQQVSYSDDQVLLLFHPESPVKVEKLLELIHRDKGRFRLSPDGRLSFTPREPDWAAVTREIATLLENVGEGVPAPDPAPASPVSAAL